VTAQRATPDARGVAMIGNLNMDLIIRGVPHPPVWGQEVIGSGYTLVPAGQAAYSAFALRALGVPVRLVAGVGEDPWGREIVAALTESGVDCRGVEVLAGTLTGITVALVRPDGERGFVSDYAALYAYDEGLIRRHEAVLLGAPVLAFCGLNTLPRLRLGAARDLFRKARRAGVATVLDTGWDPGGWPAGRLEGLRDVLAECSAFLPNRDEAAAITGHSDPRRAARALRDMGVGLAVIKLGPEGSYALGDSPGGSAGAPAGDAGRPGTPGGGTAASRRPAAPGGPAGLVEESLPALPVTVLDAVGAGDVYVGGFVYGMLCALPVRDCMALGSAAASLYISRELERFPALPEVMAAAKAYGLSQEEGER
jgi:ribokinase